MWIFAPVIDNAVAFSLCQGVTIGESALLFITETAIEVITVSSGTPKGDVTFNEQVIGQLSNGTVESLHERTEILADFQVSESVIVIVEQRSNPREEIILLGVVVKTIPKDLLRRLAGKRRIPVAASCSDEIHLIVQIPMLETVVALVGFGFCRGALAKSAEVVHGLCLVGGTGR